MIARKRKRLMKEENLNGKLRQKVKGGPYYYRLMVANGLRKEFALKTSDYDEACKKAADLDSIWDTPNKEVAIAQIKAIRGFSKAVTKLPLSEIWKKYEVHPDRARPLTVHEPLMYQSTLQEFIEYAKGNSGNEKNRRPAISSISEITSELVSGYADYLRTTKIAVSTHNRKMRRLRKIFECLKDYCGGENPFRLKTIFRNEREEQSMGVRRLAFSKEQELQLREVLSDNTHKVKNKHEIRVIYYLGMFTGQRLKDCVLLLWQNIDMENRRIWVKQFKTGKEVTIPIADELYFVLDEAKKWKTDQYVCPLTAARYNKTDAKGKNVGNNLVNLDVLRVIRWIGLEPSVPVEGRNRNVTVYGFHSLRHSFASFCAEAGVPKAVLLSILGTDSDIADKYYVHIGEDAQRSAIRAISGESSINTLKDRVQKVISLLDSKPEPSQEILAKIRKMLTQGHIENE